MLASRVCLLTAFCWINVIFVVNASEQCAESVAVLVSVQGTLEVQPAHTLQWHVAEPSAQFCAGDTLTVHAHSRAVVRILQAQTNIQLDQNSTIVLPAVVEEEFSLLELVKGVGHFISRVPRTLKVKTPFVNAAVTGTEFLIDVEKEHTLIAVSEGQVEASNDQGHISVGIGQNVLVQANSAPVFHVLVDPIEAVQWTMYYPPLFDFKADAMVVDGTDEGRTAVAKSITAYKNGDWHSALKLLDLPSLEINDIDALTYRASLYLSVGRVDEAKIDIEKAKTIAGETSAIVSLQAIIAITQNRTDAGYVYAQQAVKLAPDSAAARIALSYAYQARFELSAALKEIQEAVNRDPANALAWARLAELWLMQGELNSALKAAQRAVSHNPHSAQAYTVLGFAYLTQNETDKARATFEKSIQLDQAAPLPRLGLGLAFIGEGQVETGRMHIESATSLDPRNSLLRSYVGKAYYEERRDTLADQQFSQAKIIDPKDPTPWFYDAILKKSQYRSVDALLALQKSIELNDNRAVYRSRLLLDNDLAARSVSLAQVYQELHFDQLAMNEATKSVDGDPSNYSAHRFLAEAYAKRPRQEIARASELLQAQLLQPINLNAIQPQLQEQSLPSQGNSAILDYGFNEYSRLFLSEPLSLRANLIGGSEDTYGNDFTASLLGKRASLSAGQFYYRSDGFRENADIEHQLYNLLGQWAVSPSLDAQLEFRRRESDVGDIKINFDPEKYSPKARQHLLRDTSRMGVHWKLTSKTDVIGSFSKLEKETTLTNSYSRDEGYQSDARLISQFRSSNVTFGVADFKSTLKMSNDQPSITSRHRAAYLYSNFQLPRGVLATVGASFDDFEQSDGLQIKKLNPKLGLTMRATPWLTLRAGTMDAAKRSLLVNQSLEPTQVAGFNQFYDEPTGSRATQHGIGVDVTAGSALQAGSEWVQRRVSENYVNRNHSLRKEYTLNSYIYWTINPTWQLTVLHNREDVNSIIRVDTNTVPLSLRFQARPFSASLTARQLRQQVNLGSNATTDPDNASFGRTNENVWLFDTDLSYKLAKRSVEFSLRVQNIANQSFLFQDSNYRTPIFSGSPDFVPGRKLLFLFTVNY